LVILPCFVGVVAWELGLPDLSWRVAILTAAVPTGANAILLARRKTNFSEASANTVLLATALSVLTITVILDWVR
jgi:malonate transporter and related proteins